jgi:hypothetical protein
MNYRRQNSLGNAVGTTVAQMPLLQISILGSPVSIATANYALLPVVVQATQACLLNHISSHVPGPRVSSCRHSQVTEHISGDMITLPMYIGAVQSSRHSICII